ncbi:hypothetical protein [Halomonas lysinitropha]|uniref:Uncharacterized protein n=1 Tax=Halomonas lysinitropha TaxID=2607506 RepID=A0A5K1I5T1_9GAMM|nr:hypothetical protein [Halomonas lysinitropha]VVZ96806.1 hypothetical protein HALO32_02913 [Halomonas lysinitropha]
MSNGPYGQIACDCGAVSLLVCGAPLGLGLDAVDEPVTFWPLDAIQIGQGADELDVSPQAGGGDCWACRRCRERLLCAHEEAGVAVLTGQEGDASDHHAPAMTSSWQRSLEALGYRVRSVPGA